LYSLAEAAGVGQPSEGALDVPTPLVKFEAVVARRRFLARGIPGSRCILPRGALPIITRRLQPLLTLPCIAAIEPEVLHFWGLSPDLGCIPEKWSMRNG
jgi:hypothetical protein